MRLFKRKKRENKPKDAENKDEETKDEETKNPEPKDPDSARSHGYFYGHECHLGQEQLSEYRIKSNRIGKIFFDLITVRASDIRAINMYRSYAALCAERFRHHQHFRFAVHPFSKLRLYLEIVFVVMMIYSSSVLATHYGEGDPDMEPHYHKHVLIFCDVIVIVNIIANFFTGYIEGLSHKVAVLSLGKIGCRYIRTWFVVDILASIGISLEFFDIDTITPRLTLESMKLLRIPIIVVYLRNILTVMRATIYQKTAVEIIFFFFIFFAWNIYFQFIVEYMIDGKYVPNNPRNCSWLTVGKLWNQSSRVRVLYAFDRAVGMLTTNTNMNLLNQPGCFQNFIVIYWIASKLFVCHFALKYVIALFGKESARANYYIMTKQLETYMVQRNFPPRLKKKILKFYAIRFQSKYFEETRMLGCMSGQLREDILMHTGRQLVRELDFLKQMPSSLLVQIAVKLRVVIYIAGDIIFKINTVGDCLYFIDRGTVAIYSGSAKEICHLEDGDFFGEIALVMKHHFRTASAIAVTNCELFELDREHFESTIAHYPMVYDNIKEVATSRYETTCVLDEHHKAELKTAEEYATM